jgi:hypothetical protein
MLPALNMFYSDGGVLGFGDVGHRSFQRVLDSLTLCKSLTSLNLPLCVSQIFTAI